MIERKSGNIFNSKAAALVNPVNCVGVMGKGLALEFKKRFPKNFDLYEKRCASGPLVIGWPVIFTFDEEKIIFNFPTKIHWKDKSQLEWIERGLDGLIVQVYEHDITSIATPLLGCGLGGLKKSDVYPLIQDFADSVPNTLVEVWEYSR